MKILILLFLFCYSKISHAQDISAKYLVSASIDLTSEDPNSKKVIELEYDGYLYKKGSIYISFMKPLYLKKYPDGYIVNNSSTNNSNHSFHTSIWMDTIQYIKYISIDSLVMRSRTNTIPPEANLLSNIYREFEINYQKWEILPEEKIIDGLKCQRAKWTTSSGTVSYDVWFCADLPIESNFMGLLGLPGMIVEGECVPWKLKFHLQSYEFNTVLTDAIIWPPEFNEGFRTLAPIIKRW